MTHALLVQRAVRWLRGTQRCAVAFGELVTSGPEVPDAIGWTGVRSHLVEVKVSRSDFKRNASKLHPRGGVGCWRWFLTPRGLLDRAELPDGWGLLEAGSRSIRVVHLASARDHYDTLGEIGLLMSAARRHQLGIPFDALLGRFATLSDPAHPRNQP